MKYLNIKEKNPSENLKSALFYALIGIEKSLELKENDLAEILHRSPIEIINWKAREEVPDCQIIGLIDLYDSISSLFMTPEDQVTWFHTSSEDFEGYSPLEFLKAHPKNVYVLLDWFECLTGDEIF